MRILVDGMPRTKGGIGSLIISIAEYARKYYNEPLEFVFIIAGYSGYLEFLQNNGYKYFVAPSYRNTKDYLMFVKKIFSENHFDYLWYNNTSKVNIILPTYAKKQGTKVITHPHGVDFEEKGIKRLAFMVLNRLNRKKMFSMIDVPFACSKAAADIYYKGAPDLRERAVIINNGINTRLYTFSAQKREMIRNELLLREDDVLLGTVGRLTAVKNYPFIINMLSFLPEHFRMAIIGEGEDRESLEHLITEKGLMDRCFILGSRNNVPEYLSAMDFFLLPSINEGMPFSIIEAQSEGLKCVVSDTLSKDIGLTELVAFLPISSPEVWAEYIMSHISQYNRAVYPKKIQEQGYSIEETFSRFINSIR